MPVEDMEEQGLAKIPDLGVAQLKFQLQNLNYTNPTAKQQVSLSFRGLLRVLLIIFKYFVTFLVFMGSFYQLFRHLGIFLGFLKGKTNILDFFLSQFWGFLGVWPLLWILNFII